MNNLPIVFIACRVFEKLLARRLPAELKDRVAFLDYGLHANPKNLRKTLQAAIDEIKTPSLIALGYGLCGNGLKDIQSGIHTLLLPKTEDCIAIFLGSDETYRKEFNAHPGTYYLTGGWLEAGSDPLKEYEKYVEKYGQKTADFVMNEQYKNYKRLALVGHSEEDLAEYRERAMRVAEYCKQWGMAYREIRGSERYVKRLVEAATDLSQADGAFLVVPPGGKIEGWQ
ncbi:MAG: DUF1638 domain-containing protein [Chloroflexi bacterium]|nr:DUF1638 domain-containing protein [Chloroflexota bacterium]MCA2001051.1 DUF1638 domain-containing protein [Chloroflexota bacterium]